MEKVKGILNNPKKTTILGLTGSIILLLFYMFYMPTSIIARLLNSIEFIGFTVYFIIVFMRITGKGGNIKTANYILIASFIVPTVLNIIRILSSSYVILDSYNNYIISVILGTTLNIITILYFSNILLRKTKLINNKVFAIATIIYVVFLMTQMSTFNLLGIFLNLCILTRIPYFYIYYELLKGENNNGK